MQEDLQEGAGQGISTWSARRGQKGAVRGSGKELSICGLD